MYLDDEHSTASTFGSFYAKKLQDGDCQDPDAIIEVADKCMKKYVPLMRNLENRPDETKQRIMQGGCANLFFVYVFGAVAHAAKWGNDNPTVHVNFSQWDKVFLVNFIQGEEKYCEFLILVSHAITRFGESRRRLAIYQKLMGLVLRTLNEPQYKIPQTLFEKINVDELTQFKLRNMSLA